MGKAWGAWFRVKGLKFLLGDIGTELNCRQVPFRFL